MPPSLLKARDNLSCVLADDPYQVSVYHMRAIVYRRLGYPDLAAMDSYKMLLLMDEIIDDSSEYHAEARHAVKISDTVTELIMSEIGIIDEMWLPSLAPDDDEAALEDWATSCKVIALTDLAHNLATIGCLQTSFDSIQKALTLRTQDETAAFEKQRILDKIGTWASGHGVSWNEATSSINVLPDSGLVRREVYAWNVHETDRNSQAALDLLNLQMSTVAPKLEVCLAVLPNLTDSSILSEGTVTQLGVFAKTDIEAGEEILRECSMLTASARRHEPLCDACSAELPGLDDTRQSVSCPDCDDVVFCSEACLNLATTSYHPAICEADVDNIAKDVPAAEAIEALYTQLLFRALAMAQTQNIHALDLHELKYIWGDFTLPNHTDLTDDLLFESQPRTLPFSFQAQIVQPLHYLEKMNISPFTADYGLTETWVYNTILAKCRGTASARMGRDGRPEVAAVHPLWCLANHSCDPNVSWEWAGEIKFHARKDRAIWKRQKDSTGGHIPNKPGIKKGDEILNHYVDIDLPVQERREWGSGALGGHCKCARCTFEAEEEF